MNDKDLKRIQKSIDEEYSELTVKHDKWNDGVIVVDYEGKEELGIRSTESDYNKYEVSVLTDKYIPFDFIENMVSYMKEEEQDNE